MFEWIAFDAITLLCGLLPGKEAIVAIGANAVINYTTVSAKWLIALMFSSS